MATLGELRERIAPRERAVTLATGGGLLAEHDELLAEFEAATAAQATSLAGDPRVRDLAAALADLEARIAEQTVTIRVRAIGRNAFNRLLDAHPDPEGGPFNRDTFPPALVAACAVDPTLTDAEAVELADLLTDGQWDQVFDAAWTVCREVDEVPFTALASTLTRD